MNNNLNIDFVSQFDVAELTEKQLTETNGGGSFAEDLGWAVGTVVGSVVCGVKCFVSYGGQLFSK